MPRRASAWALLALLALAAGVMAPTLREAAMGRDLQAFFYPKLEACGQALSAGTIPRWNPYAEHGASHFGPRNGGVLYPAYALFGWLPPARAMSWFLILHVALGAAGAWALARQAGRPLSGAAAAVCYGGGGFLTSMYWALPYLVSAAWLPWALLGGWRMGLAQRRGAPLLASSVGLIALTAEAQGALTAGLGGLALAVWTGARGPGAIARVAAIGALAAGLATLQLVSIAVELPHTDRSLAAFHDARWDFAPAALLLDLLAGGAAGEAALDRGGFWGWPLWDGLAPWCGASVGAVGLAAALIGATRRGRPLAQLGAGLALVGLLATVTRLGAPLNLRFACKWWVLVALGLALLAAEGFAAWGHDARARRAGAWLTGGLAALTLGGAAVALLGGQAVADTLAGTRPGYVDGGAARVALGVALTRTGVCAAAGAALLALAPRQAWPPRPLLAGLLGLLAFELVLAGQGRVLTTRVDADARPPLADALHAASPGPAPPRYDVDTDAILAQRPFAPAEGLTRLDLGAQALNAMLESNLGHRHGIRQVIPFESVFDRATSELQRDPRYAQLPRPLRWALIDAELALVTREALRSLGRLVEPLTEVAPGVILVRNLACPPFAYAVPGHRWVEDRAAALDGVLDPRRFPLDLAVLGPDLSGARPVEPPSDAQGEPGHVTLVRFETELLELEAALTRPAWVVVREAFHPDWVAEVDGRPAVTVRADVIYRAVAMPAGRHRLRFVYAPRWWTPAAALNALAWLLWLGLALRAALSGREAPPRESRPPPRR